MGGGIVPDTGALPAPVLQKIIVKDHQQHICVQVHTVFIHNVPSGRVGEDGPGDPFGHLDVEFIRQDPDDIRLFDAGDGAELPAQIPVVHSKQVVARTYADAVGEGFYAAFPERTVDDLKFFQLEVGIAAEKGFVTSYDGMEIDV